MILWCKHILLFLTLLLSSAILRAQEFPVLAPDTAVKTGILSNGTTYYIVSNNSIKGFADFALVQTVGKSNIPDTACFKAIEIAKSALASSPRCLAPTVQDFFISHGVTPGKTGFVEVSDNATRFHFRDVLLSEKAVLDSALLVLLDVVDRVSTTSDDFIRNWYAPSDNAIIVSGDINASDVEYKLQMMSMMTPAVNSNARVEYRWCPSDTAQYVLVSGNRNGLAEISATWRSSRPSLQNMNTVQPVIYEMFLTQLGKLAKEGIREELFSRNIPVADVSADYIVGDQSGSDETFTVSVAVAQEHFEVAVAVLSSVMAGIDAGYTAKEDLARVKRICIDAGMDLCNEPIRNNSDYVDRCVAAFLYNSSLAPLKSKLGFLASRLVDPAMDLKLFNAISAALLDSEKNLTVSWSADAETDVVRTIFNSGWKSPALLPSRTQKTVNDIPAYVSPDEKTKLKIKSTKADHMSGGVVWTFSNGFTVIYKAMETGGRLYYNFALNEGFSSIRDLNKGEGGYISEQLFMGNIGGMSSQEFLGSLNAEGVSMEVNVGITSMMLKGSVPEDNLGLLLNALLAVMYDRTPDKEAFEYYAKCEALALMNRAGTPDDRLAAIDSIICKDYKYSAFKSLGTLVPDIQDKADTYFASQAQKTNDGVLVLIGNMNETELKKVLLKYVDAFKTTERAFGRPSVRYQPMSGCSMYTNEGDENVVEIAMSAPLALTADNFMAAEIASMVLENHLSEALVNNGLCLSVRHDCRIYPQERLSMRVTLTDASPDGFAPGVKQMVPLEAVNLVRSVLSGTDKMEISAEELSLLKKQLKGAIALEMNTPKYWMNVITRRYLSGKDFTTNYAAKIDAVSVDKVRNILVALNKGSKVEYIVSKK